MTLEKKQGSAIRLELLGIGSSKNRELKANLLSALEELSLDIPILEVQDIQQLLQYDITGIPALVLNGHVLFQKIVPSVEDLKIVLNVFLKKASPVLPLRKILVPTDFSGTAENALRFAMALAEQVDAGIRLVHVHQPQVDVGRPIPVDPETGRLADKMQLLDQLGREKGHKVNGTAVADVPVQTQVITGFVVEEIRNLSKIEEVDLIIMGTTGENVFLGKLFGSISSEIARKAHCPVLLVPKGVIYSGFRRIIYASNYHPQEESILPKVIDFASRFNAEVHFAHINEHHASPYEVRRIQLGKLPEMNGLSFQLTTIDSIDVLQGLSRYADEQHADLMIMATSHRNLLEDLFIKSITRRMVFNTRIPLMILHFGQ